MNVLYIVNTGDGGAHTNRDYSKCTTAADESLKKTYGKWYCIYSVYYNIHIRIQRDSVR